MRRDNLIGFLFVLFGILILLYKKSGFYGWAGYVDRTWENIIISSVLILTGLIIIKIQNKDKTK